MLNLLKPIENLFEIFNFLRIRSVRKKFNIKEVRRMKTFIEGINLITFSIIFVSGSSIEEPELFIIFDKNLNKKSRSS